MRPIILLLAWLAMTASALAQIDVPAENREHVPIPVSVQSAVPQGAKVDGPGWVIPPKVNVHTVDATHLVVCAPPGEYTIEYQLEWIHVEPITFIDGTGKSITFNNFLGNGKISQKATFKVLGGTPPVPPPPPPLPPGGPYQVVLFYSPDQLDNLTADQREILNSMAYREKLKAAGHSLLGVLAGNAAPSPQSKFRPFYNAVDGDPMPRVAVASKDGGKVVDFPLPATAKELDALLATEVLK